jgi:membrane glycosyltransferase
MAPRAWLRRILYWVSGMATTATAVFGHTLSSDGVSVTDVLLMPAFAILFSWVAFWCCVMTIGAYRVWHTRSARAAVEQRRSQGEPLPPTVVLIPIYNEHAERVFGRVRAMLESLCETSCESAFTFFVLSDTTDPDTFLREELAWVQLRRDGPFSPPVYYRRRAKRFRNKSGNIHDFLEHWGAGFEYMIVLDADSLMDGRTMVELVRRMDAAPRLGILQAPALPAMRSSLYARLQQFAASAYGGAMFAGLAACFQGFAAFWGHNAIVRVRAFMNHCGLPGLPGVPPFGGPILSHDFVEGALMRRSGYEVRLAWDLVSGSFEQPPASLGQSIARDRRWCQGNLQHARLLLSPAFPFESRAHFWIGILFYAASLLWAVFIVLFAALFAAASFVSEPSVTSLPIARTTLVLTLVSAVLLMAGKSIAVFVLLLDGARCKAHGGRAAVLASACLEGVLTAVTAPIVMVSHVIAVFAVTFGISVGWGSTQRDETSSPFGDAARVHAVHSLVGAVTLALCLRSGPALCLWLSPIWGSLLVAIPLGALLSSRPLGIFLRRKRLLLSPQEVSIPSLLDHARRASVEYASSATFTERFASVVDNPWLNLVHTSLLDHAGPARPRRTVEDLVRRCIEEGPAALTADEAATLLGHPWAMRALHEQSRHLRRQAA